MAGRGPAPKANRRRSAAPSRGDWVDLAPLAEPVLAPLPLDTAWPEATLEMWEAWRYDPATQMWSPADIGFAFDTIRLHAENAGRFAGEIRLRMDNLGLTQKGKRDNRWRLVDTAPAADGNEAPGGEPRLWVVGD